MGKPFQNLAGKKFFRFTVLDQHRKCKNGHTAWLCRCDCGTMRWVMGTHLATGMHKSCGCLKVETSSRVHRTHGRSHTRTNEIWKNMKRRCLSPKMDSYKWYGGRGITVCQRWIDSFENFIADMGEPPTDEHTLDRIDNDKGYYKENCRWATRTEQSRNRRNNRIIEFRGIARPLSVWSEITGIPLGTISHRLTYGWAIEDVLTRPVRHSKSHS